MGQDMLMILTRWTACAYRSTRTGPKRLRLARKWGSPASSSIAIRSLRLLALCDVYMLIPLDLCSAARVCRGPASRGVLAPDHAGALDLGNVRAALEVELPIVEENK